MLNVLWAKAVMGDCPSGRLRYANKILSLSLSLSLMRYIHSVAKKCCHWVNWRCQTIRYIHPLARKWCRWVNWHEKTTRYIHAVATKCCHWVNGRCQTIRYVHSVALKWCPWVNWHDKTIRYIHPVARKWCLVVLSCHFTQRHHFSANYKVRSLSVSCNEMLSLGELTLSKYNVHSLIGTKMMLQGEMTW